MANGDFAFTMKLGSPTKEIELTVANGVYPIWPFGVTAGQVAAKVDNLVGEGMLSLHNKFKPRLRITLEACSPAMRDAIMSLYSKKQLSFIYAENWAIYSEEVRTATTTTLTLPTNSHVRLDKAYNALSGAAIISNFAVYAVDHGFGTPGGTNYYTSGSYARATGVITLGSSPGAAGTLVYVSYTYTGALVRFAAAPKSDAKGFTRPTDGKDAWHIAADLEGI